MSNFKVHSENKRIGIICNPLKKLTYYIYIKLNFTEYPCPSLKGKNICLDCSGEYFKIFCIRSGEVDYD